MAEYTMHHLVVGSDTYEIVDETARENVAVALSAYPTDTASGTVASFPDGADGVPVKSLSVAVEAVQSGSGDPSPTNVRPISGWDSVKVARCGKNLIALEALSLPTSGHEIKDNNGKITTSSSSAYTHGYIGVKPGTKYTIIGRFTTSSSTMNLYAYDTNRDWIQKSIMGSLPSDTSSITFTTGSNTHYIQLQYINTSSGADPTTWGLYEGETVADDTEQGQTYTIALPQTVYGGTLDVSTGELVIDHVLVDLGTLTWTMPDSTNHIFRTTEIVNHKKTSRANYLCSAYLPVNSSVSGTAMEDKTCKGNSNNGTYLYVRDTDYSDAATFKTSLSGVMLCYEMDELQTLTLTPEQVTTLLGTNNIYADAGSVAVTYRADTGLYIDKRLNA